MRLPFKPFIVELNLLKFEDKINLENVLFVSKYVNNLFPPVFGFTFCSNILCCETVPSPAGKLF